MAVTLIDIMNTLYSCLKMLISIIFYIVKSVIVFFFKTVSRILSYIGFLLPFSPFAIVIICVFIILAILWDEVTIPLIYGIMDAINGIIGGWNTIAYGVRDIGFRIPGIGYVRMGGIPLPTANEIEADIPNFWDFILSIIKPLVLEPLEKALKGVIIR
jgi:hypothetical protein